MSSSILSAGTPVDLPHCKQRVARHRKSARTSLLGSLDDRVVALGVETEQVPGLRHMRRQRRAHVNGSAARMWYHDTARQQMQFVLHAAGQLPVLDVEIF